MPDLPTPADEGRHPPSADPGWEESWTFEFVSHDGGVAGLARLALLPNLRRAWWWAYVVRPGLPLLVVRDHEVALPRAPLLEIRAEGLWAELSCLIPLDHWTIGLEAFAVALDDPEDALHGERGERVGLGFDLEWEAAGDVTTVEDGYRQPSRVHGEVLIGQGPTPTTTAIDGWGGRSHRWGVLPPLDGDARASDRSATTVGEVVVPLDAPREGIHRRLLLEAPAGQLVWS